MARKRRPFVRSSAVRDARLIIIAAEDTTATVAYFRALISPDYYQNPRVHVEVLQRDATASAPEHVLAQIDGWRTLYDYDETDEFWLVIDVDKWGEEKLSQIAQSCAQKAIRLAVSNPAIELWFLLHRTDLTGYTPEELGDLLRNERVSNHRTRLEQEIVRVVGRYNKSNLHIGDFLPHVAAAVLRAEALDHSPADRWPQGLGSHVYRLIRSIAPKLG